VRKLLAVLLGMAWLLRVLGRRGCGENGRDSGETDRAVMQWLHIDAWQVVSDTRP